MQRKKMQDKYLISFQLSNYNEIKLDQSYLSNIVEVENSKQRPFYRQEYMYLGSEPKQ